MAAQAAQASRDASAPVDITVDGHAGKSIILYVQTMPGSANATGANSPAGRAAGTPSRPTRRATTGALAQTSCGC